MVNLNNHPTGFAEPGAIESAELKASGRTGLLELSPRRLRAGSNRTWAIS